METINLRINHLAEIFFNGNNVKFAEKVESSEANIRNYRKKSFPKTEFIVKTCEILNINFDWLLTGKGEMLRGFEMPTEEAKDLSKYVGELKLKIETLTDSLKKTEISESQLRELLFFHKEKIQILEQKLQDCEQEKKPTKTIS